MKLISFQLGGQWRSLVAPADAAAWAIKENDELGKAAMFFRMKRVCEHSQLTSLRLAKQEKPDLDWMPTGTLPWLETNDGQEDALPKYSVIEFTKDKSGQWAMDFQPGFGEFVARQNDLASHPAKLPQQAYKTDEEVVEFLKQLTGRPEPAQPT